MGPSEDVLVVDDDPDMVELMLIVLEQAGYAARSARNGREALSAAAERTPALVLLDMLMPVMNGWECAYELRARYGSELKIVVVTAAEHPRARADEVGADDVLPKPFDMSNLLRVVARYVHRAS
jgi:DNA-binding response OmpR family regulator